MKMDFELTTEKLQRDQIINQNNASSTTIMTYLNEDGMVVRRLVKIHFVSKVN